MRLLQYRSPGRSRSRSRTVRPLRPEPGETFETVRRQSGLVHRMTLGCSQHAWLRRRADLSRVGSDTRFGFPHCGQWRPAAELQTQDTRTFLCCEPSGFRPLGASLAESPIEELGGFLVVTDGPIHIPNQRSLRAEDCADGNPARTMSRHLNLAPVSEVVVGKRWDLHDHMSLDRRITVEQAASVDVDAFIGG